MRRILVTTLVLLVALGLGISALHTHATGQDCAICKVVTPTSTALVAVTAETSLSRCAQGLAPMPQAAPAQRRFNLSLLRAPPIA